MKTATLTQLAEKVLAHVGRASLGLCWFIFLATLLWKAVFIDIDFRMLIIIPAAFLFLFVIHLLSFTTSLFIGRHGFSAGQIVYYTLSDIFFLLLIIYSLIFLSSLFLSRQRILLDNF